MSLLLDTHAWVWWMEGDLKLGRKAIAALDGLLENERPFLCDISLWEIATLFSLGRWTTRVPFENWLAKATHPRTLRIVPITAAVGVELTRLPAEFHRDPADRIIVATARALHLPLLTRDRQILASKLTKRWLP
jgi:PIN domain nuclease of toxin-antitoxin system